MQWDELKSWEILIWKRSWKKFFPPPNVTFMSTVPNLIFFWHPPPFLTKALLFAVFFFEVFPKFAVCRFFLRASKVRLLIIHTLELDRGSFIYVFSLKFPATASLFPVYSVSSTFASCREIFWCSRISQIKVQTHIHSNLSQKLRAILQVRLYAI